MARFWDGWDDFRPYVSASERRANALREVERRKRRGQTVSPLIIQGSKITTTFWGRAWCENLERYSDLSNRLPRGRTYVRNGSVIDLQIEPGKINALVSGTDIYEVEIEVTPVSKKRWQAICDDCAGAIDSLVELLQGRFSKGVMERICRQGTGLFPTNKEIEFSCSCPDSAWMCKHIAAVLYGIGARLDKNPELLFRLHDVKEEELIAQASTDIPLAKRAPRASKVLNGTDLSELFGLELAPTPKLQDVTKRPAKNKEKMLD